MIIKWNKEIQRYCACLIFVFTLFFIISADSYTHDLWYRNDSAWFYLSGKAWMNGMIPYVDFSDSKGPLLFLIYGIGYLICPYNYIGVFWVSVFWYSAIFFMLYKLCGLFLKDDKLSLATSLSMALAIFLPFHDTEFRAEDLCMLFIVISFYELCKIIYSENNSLFRGCFVIGICLGATFLIKFSITAMMLIFLVVGLYYLIREKKNVLHPVGYVITGLFVVFLPFFVYMVCTDSLEPFWREYILNTLVTVQGSASVKTSLMEITYIFANTERFFVLIMGILGCISCYHNFQKYKAVPLICFLWFMLIASKHTYLDKFSSYYIPATLFILFFNMHFIKNNKMLFMKKHSIMVVACVIILLVSAINLLKYDGNTPLSPELFMYNRSFRKQYYDVNYLMSQVANPTYINWHESQECGIGVPVNSLPGTKYNTLQAGFTKEMELAQTKAVLSGSADFVVAPKNDKYGEYSNQLMKIGYKAYYEFEHPRLGGPQVLFSKHDLKMPSKDYVISNHDIIMKKRIPVVDRR